MQNTRKWRGTVVEFHVEPDPEGHDRRGILQYCSNHIGKALGLGNRLVLTPYQLYRRLLAAGGEVVYSWRDHENQEQPNR